MRYSNDIIEYIRVRLEQTDEQTKIAREVKKKFNISSTVDAIRKKVASVLEEADPKEMKRLFCDIETSYVFARVWGAGKQWVDASKIVGEKKIICISWKWHGDDQVNTLKWDKNQGDKKLVKKFLDVLEQAHEVVMHNGDRFDIPEIRTRAISHGLKMPHVYRTTDTLKKARKYFRFQSNRLDYLGDFLNVGRKLSHEGMDLWVKVVENRDPESLKRMIDYCEQDVILLEDVHTALSPYVDHNTNYSVLTGGPKWACPECGSKGVRMHRTDTTAMGYIRRFMLCSDCNKQYKISNRSYMGFLVERNT